MNDRQNLNELAQLAEIFAEAAFEHIAQHPTLGDRFDEILGTDDTNRLFALEHEVALTMAAIEMEALLGGVEKGGEQDFVDEANARMAKPLIALAELYARVIEYDSVLTAASLMPDEARSADISERFAKAGAPALARLAGFKPSPPAFGFVHKPR